MAEAVPHAALARAVATAFGAGVRIASVEPLAGDASTRRYVRLRLAGDGAPPTVVAMLLGEGRFAPGSDELGDGTPVEELPFVNVGRWLAARGFDVPAIHVDAARTDGLLLLDDVGDTTLWAAVTAAPADAPRLFAAAVDVLVTLQVAGARHPDPACYAFRRRFDTRLARAEVEHFVDHGIETRRGAALPAADRRALLAALEPVTAPFAAPERVFSHRDYMAWNLHVQDGRLRIIDFQDALMAPDAFDLAQLLTDRTTPTVIDAAAEAALVERFLARRAAAGFPVPDGFAERYRLCALQHALKVIGRFWFLERVRGRPGYLAYLPAVYGCARRMFAALPALAAAQALAARHVPELAPEAT